MAGEIDNLIDRANIVDVINTLFVGTDNRNWDVVRNCFAPSVLFDMSSLGAGEPHHMTPNEIVAAWDAGLKPMQAIHHQVGNYLVTVDGPKSASAFCYGIAIHYLPNPTHANTRTFVGSYDFGLTKENGRWKIEKFKFTLKYVDGNLKLETSI
ncbi:MAG TPA: nuclear transport factor 2 family protein [Candidatus Krumholzibacteria bacterium]|nr:nuclear transport factor 2 family protein [Candidatus Krumholzibacteria bacterium]